jgi:hypothetical protein
MFNQGSYYPPAEAAAYGPDSMHEPMWIDTSFDFRSDASGKDPDKQTGSISRSSVFAGTTWAKAVH